MAREAVAFDLREIPDLARLVQEVRRTQTPIVLRDGDQDVAVLSPAPDRRRRMKQRVSPEDITATLSVFGAWKDKIDPEALKRRVREDREDGEAPRRP